MLRIVLSRPVDWALLGERWRALEARSAGSYFQSWAWVGCLAAERFAAPLLLEAYEDGRLDGLALFNERRGWGRGLWLGEAGGHPLDGVFVEHNGPLIATAADAGVRALLLQKVRGQRLVMSGIDDGLLDVVKQLPGLVFRRQQMRAAPYVAMAGLGPGADGYLASVSANTRYQLTRSMRRYGAVTVQRAESVEEGLRFFTALVGLHQAYWTARGQPGAFFHPDVLRFHTAMIGQSLAEGMVDLLRVSAGARVIGYLYNFRMRGWVAAYQSGFDYGVADRHEKPGLTCHHAAIEMYRGMGIDRYDFLAGSDRYKASLSNASQALHWIDVVPRASLAGVIAVVRGGVAASPLLMRMLGRERISF